jgi:hypothetical protein
MSSPLRKNISLCRHPKSPPSSTHPASHEGRIAIVTVRWVRDAVDVAALLTKGAKADGEVVWS